MNKGVMILWTVMLGANLGLAIFIVRWIIREFASDTKDAVRSALGWCRIGGNSDLFTLKQIILDGQKESETSLKKYITEQLSEDKTLGSAVKLDGEMYVIVGISKDVATGEVASADISLRKDRGGVMMHIVFEYRDLWSGDKWNKQECYVRSIAECKKIYGLDAGDCEYRIISVEEVKG